MSWENSLRGLCVSQRCASFPRKGNKQQLQGSYPQEGGISGGLVCNRVFLLTRVRQLISSLSLLTVGFSLVRLWLDLVFCFGVAKAVCTALSFIVPILLNSLLL